MGQGGGMSRRCLIEDAIVGFLPDPWAEDHGSGFILGPAVYLKNGFATNAVSGERVSKYTKLPSKLPYGASGLVVFREIAKYDGFDTNLDTMFNTSLKCKWVLNTGTKGGAVAERFGIFESYGTFNAIFKVCHALQMNQKANQMNQKAKPTDTYEGVGKNYS